MKGYVQHTWHDTDRRRLWPVDQKLQSRVVHQGLCSSAEMEDTARDAHVEDIKNPQKNHIIGFKTVTDETLEK